jgi:hypothetical protein
MTVNAANTRTAELPAAAQLKSWCYLRCAVQRRIPRLKFISLLVLRQLVVLHAAAKCCLVFKPQRRPHPAIVYPAHLLMPPLVGAAQAVLIFNLHCRSRQRVQQQGGTKLQAGGWKGQENSV